MGDAMTSELRATTATESSSTFCDMDAFPATGRSLVVPTRAKGSSGSKRRQYFVQSADESPGNRRNGLFARERYLQVLPTDVAQLLAADGSAGGLRRRHIGAGLLE